jgi:hypothetical protein
LPVHNYVVSTGDGLNMNRGIFSPFSPIKEASSPSTQAANRKPFGQITNSSHNVAHRKMFNGKSAKTALPTMAFADYSSGESPARARLDESLLSLTDICDDLTKTPVKPSASVNESTLSTLSEGFGFGGYMSPSPERQEAPPPLNESLSGFGLLNESLSGFGAGSLVSIDVSDTARSANNGRLTASVNVVNNEVRGVGGHGTIPEDAVEFVRAARNGQQLRNVRMVNEQARGADVGAQHYFGADSKQLSDEAKAQTSVASYRRVSEQARGELAGQQTKYGLGAREVNRQQQNQVEYSKGKMVNEQARGAPELVGQPTKFSTDSKQLSTETAAQHQIAAFRRVNEQARGEFAGLPTKFDMSSKQLSDETKAQTSVASYRRVSEQARGELAGQQTKYGLGAREVNRQQQNQVEYSKGKMVNEQARGVGRAYLPADSEPNVRAKAASGLVSDVRMINEQFRGGELTGRQNRFGGDAVQFTTDAYSQGVVADYRRVSNEARGELAGRKAGLTAESKSIASVLAAPKVQLVNNQVKHVGRGYVPFNSASSRHVVKYNAEQQQQAALDRARAGRSLYGYQGMEMARVSNAPKPAATTANLRAPDAGKRTGFGADSQLMRLASKAPKRALVNQQFAYGGTATRGSTARAADASAFKRTVEWKPASELVLAEETTEVGAGVVERPMTPSEVREAHLHSSTATANYFGLTRSLR